MRLLIEECVDERLRLSLAALSKALCTLALLNLPIQAQAPQTPPQPNPPEKLLVLGQNLAEHID